MVLGVLWCRCVVAGVVELRCWRAGRKGWRARGRDWREGGRTHQVEDTIFGPAMKE